MQTTAVRRDEMHSRGTGVPGGIHEGAGSLTLDQLNNLKTAGVPAIVGRPEKEIVPEKDEPSFELISELYFTVPKEHRPKRDKIFKDANKQMGKRYFPTDRLEAGRGVKLELYHPHNGPSLQDCLDLIESKGGLLAGPEGLLLLWFHLGEELPKEQWIHCLDKEEKLPKDEYGNPMVLSIFKSSMQKINEMPHLVRVDGPISNKNCLIVLTYEES